MIIALAAPVTLLETVLLVLVVDLFAPEEHTVFLWEEASPI